MKEQIQGMLQISEELENIDISDQLRRLLDSLEHQQYCLTFMGQFSAGKSRLINSLLEKEILPVHITETTALITFIQYDTTDHADIFYKDGSQETVSIEESRELWQSGNTEKISEISHLHIYVNHEFLQSGLMIADTPGVNTIIQQHVEMTANVIGNADRVLYVLGKSVTESDMTFIQSIQASGVPILFVRTHMDEIKDTEENAEITCKKETEVLNPFTGDKIFFVSNEKNNRWYSEIECLRNYLFSNLSENLEEVLKKDIAARTVFLAAHLKKILNDRSQNLNRLMSGKETEFLVHKKEMEDSLHRMEEILQRNKESLKKKYQSLCQSAEEELLETKNAEIKRIKQNISEMKYGSSPENYVQPVENAVKNSCQRIYQNYLSAFDKMLKDNKELLNRELSEISDFSQMEIDLPETLQESEEMSEELGTRLASLQALQNSLKEELSSIAEQQEEVTGSQEQLLSEEEELRSALQSIQAELDSYPAYVPKYYEREDAHKHEENFRKAGKIIDFAMMLIPGEGWAKIGASALKVASKGAKLVKATSAARKLSKTAKMLHTSAKVSKFLKTADTAMDVGKGINHIKQTAEESENPDILDLLSVDYHLAKIGKKLDENKPSVKEIDREYEKEYYDKKREIEKRRAEQAEAAFKKRMQITGTKDKQRELQIREEAVKQSQRAAEQEMADLEKEIQRKREKSKTQYLINYYQNMAEEKIKAFAEYLKTTVQPDTEKKIEEYLQTYDFRILTDIHRKQAELSKLENEFHSMDRKKQEETSKKYQEYLIFLNQLQVN